MKSKDLFEQFSEYKETLHINMIQKIRKNGSRFVLELSEAEHKTVDRLFSVSTDLVDELAVVRENLNEQKRIDLLRLAIWQDAANKYPSEITLIEKLFTTIGPSSDISLLSYFAFEDNGDSTLIIQWSENGIDTSADLRIPKAVTDIFRKIDSLIITTKSLPEYIDPEIRKQLKNYLSLAKIEEFLAIHYPDKANPKGIISFGKFDGEFNQKEIDLLVEIVKILSLKASQIESEYALIKANTELQSKIEESTSLLKSTLNDLKADIESREKSELALRESEELYKTLIQTCPDSITLTDLDFNITMVNKATLALNGLKDDELIIGRKAFEFLAPHELQRAVENANTLRATGKMITTEYTALKYDGTPYPAEFIVSLLKDQSGNPKAFIAVIRDLTRRKMIEDALEKEKDLFEVTLRSISEGVITTGRLGKILFLNRVAEKLTGWKQADARGKDLSIVFNLVRENTSEQIEGIVSSTLAADSSIEIEENIFLISKNDKKIRLAVHGAPIRDKSGNTIGCVFVFRDTTEEKLLEHEILKAKNLESLGMLAGGIAHDFNNILTTIVTNLSLARTYLGETLPEASVCLIDAEKAVAKASKLSNQLLTFAQGELPLKESVSLEEMLANSIEFYLAGSNINWTLKIPDNLWHVYINKAQIYQVINNLIINAKESMPDGGAISVVAGNVCIKTGAEKRMVLDTILEHGNYVMVSIHDRGCGIPKEFIDKIFDPYFTTKPKGTGIGLASVYSIIKKHGGYIQVESEEKIGTNFVFYLPAAKTKNTEKGSKDNARKNSSPHILIMDDDIDIGKILIKILNKIGYAAELTKEGTEAIFRYREALSGHHPFDIVIMDLTIRGGMGGREACRHILKIDPKAKIIVSSGYSNDPILARYEDYGFVDVLVKPFSIDNMIKAIKRLVD